MTKRARRVVLACAAATSALFASVAILATAGVFTETYTGAPPAPLSFASAHWEMAAHTMWGADLDTIPTSSTAQHGPNCEPPGEAGSVTHSVHTFRELAYQCANHLMTYVPESQIYNALYMTPDQMVDLSQGTATIKFDVSTLSRSTRDWIDVWVQAWDTQEQRILDSDTPTNQGNPRNAVHIEMGAGCGGFRSGEGQFHIEAYDVNRNVTCTPGTGRWIDVLTPSAQARSTVQIDMTRTHAKVWMPQFNLILAESDIPQLAFTAGVVSFGHHSYSPTKGEDPLTGSGVGTPNTWHWDNMTITPSLPFTILHTDHRAALWSDSPSLRTFTFESPAPSNASLRFEAIGEGVRASFDGRPAVELPRTGLWTHPEHATSYFVPVPRGAQNVTFEVKPTWGFVGEVSNVSVFANNTGPAITPTATPTTTPSPTATPTPSPTATPTASATAAPTATPKVTPTLTPTATPTPSPTTSPTPTATAPGDTTAASTCEAQFRYRDRPGSGNFREVWRAVDCQTGRLLEPIR